MDPEILNLQKQIDDLVEHNTVQGQSDNYGIIFDNIQGYIEPVNVISQTIGTAAGNYDAYFLAPRSMTVLQVDFSAVDALAANDTNYITWTITNLGQDGSGSAEILAATDAETTKATGGSAIVAGTKRTLADSTVLVDKQAIQGDRIRIRAAVTGTLANTVTLPVYLIQLT